MKDSRPNIRPRKPERDSATTQPTTSSTWPEDRALAKRWLPARSWQLPVRRGGLAPRHAQPPSWLPPHPVHLLQGPEFLSIFSTLGRRTLRKVPSGACCWPSVPRMEREAGHLLWTDGKGLMRAVLSSDAMGGGVKAQTLDHLTHACALWLPRSEWNIKYRALNALIVNVRPPKLYRHGSQWSLKAL